MGLPGLLIFVALYLSLGTTLLSTYLKTHHLPALLILFSSVALLLHSQIVNSFLYSHLLIALFWAVALALTTNKDKVSGGGIVFSPIS